MRKAVKKQTPAKAALEALAPLIMVVDGDLGLKELNPAAHEFFGADLQNMLQRRTGDAFQCAHRLEAPTGCGHGHFCQICPIREAATQAIRERNVVRRRTKASIGGPGPVREVHLLVTATPLPSEKPARVLLVLEDISALIALQNPVPICASCKRVRSDEQYWEQVETHFRQHFDLDLSHGMCPECDKAFYGRILKNPAAGSQPIAFAAPANRPRQK